MAGGSVHCSLSSSIAESVPRRLVRCCSCLRVGLGTRHSAGRAARHRRQACKLVVFVGGAWRVHGARVVVLLPMPAMWLALSSWHLPLARKVGHLPHVVATVLVGDRCCLTMQRKRHCTLGAWGDVSSSHSLLIEFAIIGDHGLLAVLRVSSC